MTLASVCLHWSRVARSMPHYWSLLVIRDKFSTQKIKDALHMAKGQFETIKLYNLSASDLVRLGKILRHASHAVKTVYYETTESSSISGLSSLMLKPKSVIVRNEDPRGHPITPHFGWILGSTVRSLSLHRPSPKFNDWTHYVFLFRRLISLTVTGFRFGGLCWLYHMTAIEEIILDFKDEIFDPKGNSITRSDISLPKLRVFKLRHVYPFPTEMSIPAVRIHAPMLHTFHLDSTPAAHWLSGFAIRGAPATLVDFRVDRPNGPTMSLHHLTPFLCDTIESFALTSVSHELRPLLSDIEAGLILPRRKHLEFTFLDEE